MIYPALREANRGARRRRPQRRARLYQDLSYELDNMPKAGPAWLQRVRDFRAMLEEHMRMEEDEVFPAFRAGLTDEQNAKLDRGDEPRRMKLA